MKMGLKISLFAGMAAGWALTGLTVNRADAAAPARTAATATTTTRPKPPPEPPVPPPSVPADVNPFADEAKLPQPLKWPGAARPRIDVDVHPLEFDGLTVLQMTFRGPDFEWQFDPLGDFDPAPAGANESTAFLYHPNPVARLTFTLFARGELLPEFTPAYLAQYLAAIRAVAPKNFVLLTPFPKDVKFIQPDSYCGFQAQQVEYAIVSPTEITLHQDTFLDLNNQYLLLVSLTGPLPLVEKLKPTVHGFLAHGRILKGLGMKEEKPPAGGSAPAAPKPAET